jgi:hypothetical protein
MLFCHVEQWGERGREADAEAPEPGSHDIIPTLYSAVATGGDPLARMRGQEYACLRAGLGQLPPDKGLVALGGLWASARARRGSAYATSHGAAAGGGPKPPPRNPSQVTGSYGKWRQWLRQTTGSPRQRHCVFTQCRRRVSATSREELRYQGGRVPKTASYRSVEP